MPWLRYLTGFSLIVALLGILYLVFYSKKLLKKLGATDYILFAIIFSMSIVTLLLWNNRGNKLCSQVIGYSNEICK